ncbi:uncharacterized protein BJ171DRAFT_219102 [Polychytrium aggregatum]|uniref:uncharacterized protein n=1 Tax=Polychytrium aggregatum TaxID=110093 RepID=UPI0022FE3728|nr:uncharacterized protein BJ171DRAFT_219102 [Polychytrium aggregatum]KAI9199257.1 hypothetical protein BJ171DRAFT_219102 [Polychytrium aggregatum]
MQDLSVDLSILIQRIEVSLASLIQVYNLVFIITKLVPPSGRTTFNVAVLSVSLIVTAMFVVEFFEVEPHMYYLNNINADVMVRKQPHDVCDSDLYPLLHQPVLELGLAGLTR